MLQVKSGTRRTFFRWMVSWERGPNPYGQLFVGQAHRANLNDVVMNGEVFVEENRRDEGIESNVVIAEPRAIPGHTEICKQDRYGDG